MIRNLVEKNRTVRRFRENEPVSLDTLRELVDLARLSASGGNLRPLRFVLSCDKSKNDIILP